MLWQLVLAELLIMGATSGIAVALGRSAPPQPTTFAPDASPAFILSGYELPPELTPERWLTEWRLDWLWIAVAAFGLVAYVLGVGKVRQRGDKWPGSALINWVIGLLVLTYITSGAPSVYGRILFSAHMVDHMALTMVAPIFLVLGAPVTLALRALRARRDGSRGPREWLLIFVHSKFSQLVTHPLFAAANFAGSIVLFYYSDAFGFAMRDHVGHELMNLHFALTGYIFVLTMIGTDPLPRRAPYPMRLLLLLATMGFHAFFGVAIMGGTGTAGSGLLRQPGPDLGRCPPSLDQQMGGAVAWGIGEVPTLLVAIGVAVMWSRSDEREIQADWTARRTGITTPISLLTTICLPRLPNATPGWLNATRIWKDADERNRTHPPPGPGLRTRGPQLAEHRRQDPWTLNPCAARSCSWTSGPSAASTACTSWTSCVRSRSSTPTSW